MSEQSINKVRTVGIVSLSSGIIGEDSVQHEVRIGIGRLKRFGLNIKFMEHARKGLSYISKHPDKRAEDLIQAFKDDSIDMILCAIGGDDTYRLLPYLFDNDELKILLIKRFFWDSQIRR